MSFCENLPDYICEPCPDPEGGRIRAIAYVRADVVVTDPHLDSTWETLVSEKKAILIPNTRGEYDGGSPNEVDGYGDQETKVTGVNHQVTYNHTDVIDNVGFYDSLNYSNQWVLWFVTESKVWDTGSTAQIRAGAPVESTTTSEVAWNVVVKWSNRLNPRPYERPATALNTCTEGSGSVNPLDCSGQTPEVSISTDLENSSEPVEGSGYTDYFIAIDALKFCCSDDLTLSWYDPENPGSRNTTQSGVTIMNPTMTGPSHILTLRVPDGTDTSGLAPFIIADGCGVSSNPLVLPVSISESPGSGNPCDGRTGGIGAEVDYAGITMTTTSPGIREYNIPYSVGYDCCEDAVSISSPTSGVTITSGGSVSAPTLDSNGQATQTGTLIVEVQESSIGNPAEIVLDFAAPACNTVQERLPIESPGATDPCSEETPTLTPSFAEAFSPTEDGNTRTYEYAIDLARFCTDTGGTIQFCGGSAPAGLTLGQASFPAGATQNTIQIDYYLNSGEELPNFFCLETVPTDPAVASKKVYVPVGTSGTSSQSLGFEIDEAGVVYNFDNTPGSEAVIIEIPTQIDTTDCGETSADMLASDEDFTQLGIGSLAPGPVGIALSPGSNQSEQVNVYLSAADIQNYIDNGWETLELQLVQNQCGNEQRRLGIDFCQLIDNAVSAGILSTSPSLKLEASSGSDSSALPFTNESASTENFGVRVEPLCCDGKSIGEEVGDLEVSFGSLNSLPAGFTVTANAASLPASNPTVQTGAETTVEVDYDGTSISTGTYILHLQFSANAGACLEDYYRVVNVTS